MNLPKLPSFWLRVAPRLCKWTPSCKDVLLYKCPNWRWLHTRAETYPHRVFRQTSAFFIFLAFHPPTGCYGRISNLRPHATKQFGLEKPVPSDKRVGPYLCNGREILHGACSHRRRSFAHKQPAPFLAHVKATFLDAQSGIDGEIGSRVLGIIEQRGALLFSPLDRASGGDVVHRRPRLTREGPLTSRGPRHR